MQPQTLRSSGTYAQILNFTLSKTYKITKNRLKQNLLILETLQNLKILTYLLISEILETLELSN